MGEAAARAGDVTFRDWRAKFSDYSPDHEASHQCQAEWSAAYNADPGGKQRKLLPFLLSPTCENSLAQQIVYKSLVGRSTAERRASLIEAIEHRKQTTVTEAAAAEFAADALMRFIR
ncbi:hypothetical protein LJR009_000442 [Bosea sp. LjRoot9]|uniref:hypothetical protein n=1 Tax=Bosea sp. LjRoot9 TaxID=3342341 RepID=UPI003ED0FEC5